MIKIFNYFIQSIVIYIVLFSGKILGIKYGRVIFSSIFSKIGPFFKSNKIIEKNLSVRQSENFVKIFKKRGVSKSNQKDPNLVNLENSISSKIGLNVLIKNSKRNKGVISIEYKDLDQLNKLIDIIKNNY